MQVALRREHTFMEKRLCISPSVKSSAVLWFVRPALTTIPWKVPHSSTIRSTAAVMLASFVVSAVKALSLSGNLFCILRKSSPGSARSIEYTVAAPLSKQHSAMPNPMPRFAPVTVCRRLFNFHSFWYLFYGSIQGFDTYPQ